MTTPRATQAGPGHAGMTPSAITECPHCHARFRIRAEQVKVHAGLVRCGACRGIFDAIEHIIEGDLGLTRRDDAGQEDASPRTIIPGMIDAETDAAPSVRTSSPSSKAWTEPTMEASPAAQVARVRNLDYESWRESSFERTPREAEVDAADSAVAYRWRKKARPMTSWERTGWMVLIMLALCAALAQASYVLRDHLAERVPILKPYLAAACARLGCRLEPPRQLSGAGFVGAELAADPAHKGLLIFTATLRNGGEHAVAFPHLILTLEGLNNQPVARKVFAPAQYLPAHAQVERGLPGLTDFEIKLYLDASQVEAVGFKVDQDYL